MKTCSSCKIQKRFRAFYKNQHRCIKCAKNLAVKNKERKRETDKIYYKNTLSVRRGTPENRMRALVASLKCRTTKQNIKCEITADILYKLFCDQKGRCAQTGIVLDFSYGHGKKRILTSPSIDRKNPGEPYTVENVQLVCLFYNLAKNNSTDSEIWELMQEAVKNKGSKND